ncbi:MAG: hypothetical protein J6Z46_01430 [Lachnospiraceae bacterium]|nr:hypothetical protein [Lachnospiraceae bacterium]
MKGVLTMKQMPNIVAQREYDRMQAIRFDTLTDSGKLRELLKDYMRLLELESYSSFDRGAKEKIKEVERLLDLLERWDAQ